MEPWALLELAPDAMPSKMERFPCPCCGHLTFGEPPGSYEICPVCYWEDDPVQLRWPGIGGANIPLGHAQANYMTVGAVEDRFRKYVRKPSDDEARDPTWRPLAAAEVIHPTASYWEAVVDDADSGAPDYYWRK